MKRKFLAALLALVMVFSMIPVSASAAEVSVPSNNGYFNLSYNRLYADSQITVNLISPEGTQIDTVTVEDSQNVTQIVQIELNEEYQELYDIENATVEGGTVTEETISNDTFRFRLELSVDGSTTVTVRLCPPFENPDIENGEYDNGAIIRYQAYEPALLKLLYVNGETSVDETTDIAGVEFGFVQNYTLGDNEFGFTEVKTGANNLPYFEAGLSNAAGKGNPYNIRYLDITYSLNGGEEKTKRIYSGNLRYVNVRNNIYEIESNNDSTSIVAFYYERGAQLSTWSLYDVRFVNTGTPLGSANMPADPTYGDGNTYIFTNWDKNVGGGDPFLPYEIVADDTVVYAKKTSSQIGGTEIHVMNTDNTLINRILELYNATNEDTLGTIDYDTVKIRVNGKDGEHTNENYYSNDWRIYGSDSYYNVKNYDTEYALGNTQNTHIPHDEISSITVYFTVDDQQREVTINRGTLPGQVSVSLLGTENIIQILVNAAPSKPTEDELTGDPDTPNDTGLLGIDAVKVICTNEEATHQLKEQTYGLLDGYTLSDVQWTGDGETGYYYVDITVPAAGYVTKFSTDSGADHVLAPGTAATDTITRTITLKCEPNDEVDWYFPGECPIITIDVTCASGETTIPAPDDETVNNLLGKAIIIDCTNDEANHENEAFSLIEDTYQIGEVYMADGIPHCDVTITAPDKYAAQYSYNTNTNHPLAPADQGSQAITLKYVNGEWAIDDDGTVYYTVACEDTSTEPTPDPDPTPDPTPTPGPGGGDKPPYIPPVDPDDSGVSDLLNTDDHIQYLFGYPEGTFGPENNMTRAEVAQMFYNLLLDQDVTITKTFDDVPAGAWYAKAVNTLASLGVVSGVGNGDFEPERSITRAEFTSIAMKFAEGKTGGTNIFSDVKSTDWFYRAVVNSTQYGWIHGYGDGTFRPNNPITRVEVTAIVNNMLGREADVDFVTEHYDELNHFSDLAVSHWGYYHIVEATNDHDYTKPSSGENWTELN